MEWSGSRGSEEVERASGSSPLYRCDAWSGWRVKVAHTARWSGGKKVHQDGVAGRGGL